MYIYICIYIYVCIYIYTEAHVTNPMANGNTILLLFHRTCSHNLLLAFATAWVRVSIMKRFIGIDGMYITELIVQQYDILDHLNISRKI